MARHFTAELTITRIYYYPEKEVEYYGVLEWNAKDPYWFKLIIRELDYELEIPTEVLSGDFTSPVFASWTYPDPEVFYLDYIGEVLLAIDAEKLRAFFRSTFLKHDESYAYWDTLFYKFNQLLIGYSS